MFIFGQLTLPLTLLVTYYKVFTASLKNVLSGGTKPLPEPMFTKYQWGILAFIWWVGISQEMFKVFNLDKHLKITHLFEGGAMSEQLQHAICAYDMIHGKIYY